MLSFLFSNYKFVRKKRSYRSYKLSFLDLTKKPQIFTWHDHTLHCKLNLGTKLSPPQPEIKKKKNSKFQRGTLHCTA